MFEDVSIAHVSLPSFIPGLTSKLRKHVRTETVHWIQPNARYKLSNDKKIVSKMQSGFNAPIISQQLTSTIFYVQFKIVVLNQRNSEGKGGIFFGITSAKDIGYPVDNRDKTIYIYNNNVKSTRMDEDLIMYSSCVAQVGAVMGMVIDLECDQIRFYINGKYVAKSTRKPSIMQPIHVMIWLYFESCEIEMGDFFPYYSLESHLNAVALINK